MLLCIYSVWDSTLWDRSTGKVLVASERQWEQWIEEKYPREFRDNPYRNNEDSLEVEFEEIELPFELKKDKH